VRILPGLFIAAIAVAICGLAATSSAAAKPAARGCRFFANVPRAPSKLAVHAQLFAWAQVRCASKTNVTLKVCAMNIGTGPIELPPRPVWCRISTITAPAGHQAFARTLAHTCTVGSRWVTFVSLNGLATDRGPWAICRGIP
jgi:hypothetical protein